MSSNQQEEKRSSSFWGEDTVSIKVNKCHNKTVCIMFAVATFELITNKVVGNNPTDVSELDEAL